MDKNKLKQELAKSLKSEMSATGTGASVTPGIGMGVATKYAFKKKVKEDAPQLAAGKVKDNYAVSHFGFKNAPSIPNRPSDAIDYKKIFEDFKVGDKVTYLGHPGEITAVNKEMTGDITYNVLYDKGTGKTKVTNVWNKGGEIKPLKEIDINDPVLMAMRAKKAAPTPQIQKTNPNQAKISMLLKKRAEIERDMEQEAEPEGGPIADKYGDMLNKIDRAIAKLKGQGEWGPETNPYMDKGEIERRAAMMNEAIHIGTDLKTDSDVYFEPSTGTFSINVIDAAGNRTNKLQVNTIDDVLAKFPNWKWTREGEIEFQPEEQSEINEDDSTDKILTYLQAAKQQGKLSPDAQKVLIQWMNSPGASREEIIKVLRQLTGMYLKEAPGFKSGKEFINIKLQKYPKALAKVNNLISMIGENNFTMDMAEWIFDFFNNASFESPISEESLLEGYSQFRNETKTRTKPEQFHSAVKQVKQKVNEINRLFEYMNRLQSELSESEGGLKYKKYTEKSIQQIKESTKSLFFKSTKLK